MKCYICGKKMDKGDLFCTACGTEVSSPTMIFARSRKRKTLLRALVSVILVSIVVLVIALFVSNADSLKLPYQWGTRMDVVREEQNIIREQGQTLVCEDPFREVDRIEEFSHSSFTCYFSNENLESINYTFNESYTLSEREKIGAQYYGNHYLVHAINDSAHYSDCVWWIDDTIIIISFDMVRYIDAESFIENYRPSFVQEVRDFYKK